jgi:hypothetical protein
VNYALQKETEIQKERTNIRLEAKKEFDRLGNVHSFFFKSLFNEVFFP